MVEAVTERAERAAAVGAPSRRVVIGMVPGRKGAGLRLGAQTNRWRMRSFWTDG